LNRSDSKTAQARERLLKSFVRQTQMDMEDAKIKGNQLYKDKNFSGAAAAYSQGIDLAARFRDRSMPKDTTQLVTTIHHQHQLSVIANFFLLFM
jgi:hypothetical protein